MSKRSRYPRRSDINRARRMGYAFAARNPFIVDEPPLSHPRMRAAYFAGQWKARGDYARRATEALARALRPAADAFRRMAIVGQNMAEAIARGLVQSA